MDLTPNAQELLAFNIPQGRVFKRKVMPLGVANAPALFQELMNKILSILRRRPKVQELISRGAQMEAHIDDVLTRSRGGGLATGRCAGHAQGSRQAKHCAHKSILIVVSCDKAFQDPCHSETREQKYVQQHIRICTHGAKTGLG